jgi:hypothetical protein
MNSKENKMNSNTNFKKTKKTCTCSTCGKTGHNASNKKFHPDYEFTGVSVPTEPKQKIICQQCELFIEHDDWDNWAGRTTKWVHISEMTICINDGREDRADQAGEIMNVCFDCVGATDHQWGWVEKKDWLKEFGTEDPIAASAAAKAMCYVDQRDSPNVFPYKKCYECDGRSSCGSYVEDDWICEDCTPEEQEEVPPHPYMEELIECVKCEKEVKRMDLRWNEGGGSYTDVCEKCASGDNQDDDDSKDLIIIKGAKPEPIPIVLISENRKCLTPCKTRPMMGRSWWKCLGYDSPCSCAYEAQACVK